MLFENYYQVFPSLNHKRHSLDTTLKILIECGKSISIISCLKYGYHRHIKKVKLSHCVLLLNLNTGLFLGDNNIVLGHFEKLLSLTM